MGVPFCIQLANAMVSAPRFTNSRAPQYGFFRRTSAAINEPDDFDILLDALKCAFVFANHLEISGSGAIVFGLLTTDNTDLHELSLPAVS